MDKFIARLNIEHYRKVLAAERAQEERQLISRLLAEEEATLAAFRRRRHLRPPPQTRAFLISIWNITENGWRPRPPR